MGNCKRCLLAGAAVAALAVASPSIDASPLFNRMTYITFSRPVALPGVELPAGTYIFELALPGDNLNVVRVSSRDRRQIYLTAFTYRIERPAGMTRDQVVTFGEASASQPPPIAAWYPMSMDSGREFIYRR